MYRRYVTDVTEQANTVTFALVLRSADNAFTYGGAYFSVQKPVTDAALDAIVAKIVAEGDSAGPKKLLPADRAAMKPVARPLAHRTIEEWARRHNVADWPALGTAKGRR